MSRETGESTLPFGPGEASAVFPEAADGTESGVGHVPGDPRGHDGAPHILSFTTDHRLPS